MPYAADTLPPSGATIPPLPPIPPAPPPIEFSISGIDYQHIALGSGDDTVHIYNSTGTILEMGGGDNVVTMSGGGKNVIIFSGSGNNVFDGYDAFSGQTVSGGAGSDLFQGGYGNDSFSGGGGNDFLFGAEGNDTLASGDGDDYLKGGSGRNLLQGGAGNDIIELHAGDTASGGAGSDQFDFSALGGERGVAYLDYHVRDDDSYTFGHLLGGTEVIVSGHTITIVNAGAHIFEMFVSTADSFTTSPYSFSIFDDPMGGKD